MKRILTAFLAIATLIFNIQVSAFEPITAFKSDIRAFIDYTPIESYLINGYTYIPAEQLANYGFDVFYEDVTHSLNISRKKFATPIYTKEMWEASVSKQTHADVVDSDIKVYLDGQIANSYHIHGKILMMFDELQKYGTVEWNENLKQITVTIFKDELQREMDNAEGVVEVEYEGAEGRSTTTMKYVGQVDENNLPNGIGMTEFTYQITRIKYLGYFSHGKPNGLVYKETFHTVSKSYTVRNIRFIGKVDGNRESKREYVSSESGMTISLLREPNFGVSILPIKEIPEWTGPEIFSDRTIYSQGCYYESWNGKDGIGEYRIWHDGNAMQTIAYLNFGGGEGRGNIDKLRKENGNIRSTTDFYEYTNGIKAFYNGSIQTISGAGTTGDPIVLNDPAVGGGQSPLNISVAVNGTELSFDVLPIMQNERVLVPVRAIFESLGAKVCWNEETQTVTAIKGNKTISLQIDNNIMQVDDRELTLDVPPRVINNRTLVPIRAVSEGFEAKVDWNNNIKQITITTIENAMEQ